MFIAGTTGRLFRELAAAMIGAVAFSGFLALSLAPLLCSKLLRHEERGRLARWNDDRFMRLEAWYARRLDPALERPLIPVAAVGGLLAVSGVLFLTLVSGLAPARDVRLPSATVSVSLRPA